MAEGTIMVLKVDLGCEKCRRKIKKLLCKYPEIRDQTYFDKEDTVIIKVVCCNPERIRQKLICKGEKLIKSIEIRLPEMEKKSPPSEKQKQKETEHKQKETEQKQKETEKKQKETEQKTEQKQKETEHKQKETEKKQKETEHKQKETEQKPKVPVTGYPPMFYPRWVWCKQCFEGQWGGPCHCHHGSYWIPYQQPPSSYDGYVRLTPSYDGWPSGCRCDRSHGCRCEYNNENYPSCTPM